MERPAVVRHLNRLLAFENASTRPLRHTRARGPQDQKESSTENLKVVVRAVEAISTNTDTMEIVGGSVEANTKATEEIARDVRELGEDLRREN
jgi:hypothetical protein